MRESIKKKRYVTSGLRLLLILLLSIPIGGVNAQKPWYDKADRSWTEHKKNPEKSPAYTVYLIGDAGEPDFANPSALKILEGHLKKANTNSVVVFLGDNIYPAGMPEDGDVSKSDAEAKINGQLDILKTFRGKVVFVPGNHDWNHWRKTGLEGVRREENYVEKYLDRGNVFLPDNGCPGPSVVNLTDDLVLVSIDSQWWLHRSKRTDEESAGCLGIDDETFLAELDAVLLKNKGKQIIVTAHHPLITNGNHGGYFRIKDHIFPFTAKYHNMYIPLPVLGSIYPMGRKHLGHIQDLAHPRYQLMISSLWKMFAKYDNLVYAAGHEHNLQYFPSRSQHYLVSGSGSKTTRVAKGHHASFTYSRQGFLKLDYYSDQALWLEAWVTGDQIDDKGEVVFRKELVKAVVIPPPSKEDKIDFADSTITVVGGADYAAKGMKTFILGKHYRKAWAAPIEVPLMDLSREQGGIRPIQIGGGFQTKSLRLGNEDGKEFIFRSINKDPKKILDKSLRKTWIADVMQDQISMAHPYGAFVIPPLAKAVGIYHKNPKLVFVPDDPLLGEFRTLYKNTLALYEERASKNLEDYSDFGNAHKAINTRKLLQKLYGNHHYAMDNINLLRNRLFDIWVGDWDRHEDQWRWVKYKCKKDEHKKCHHAADKEGSEGTLYRPIPRDRDQVFVLLDGVLPWIVRRKWLGRLLPHFQNEIKDMEGLNINGGHIDRSFLNGLSREEWIRTAQEVQAALPDKVIEDAIKLWPDTIFALDGEAIIDKLKHRRDLLVESAERYYEILAKQVHIIGTHHAEYFEITRLDNNKTNIKVYTLNKSKEKGRLLYDRTLFANETKEVRIWAQGGDDQIELTGDVKKGIVIRVIAGEGKDVFNDASHVSGMGKKTRIYDDLTDNSISVGKEARDLTSDDHDIHSYDRKIFKYNVNAPLLLFGFNVDDGMFIGGGVSFKTFGFRKHPYGMINKISGSTAIKTGAFNFYYDGRFIHLIKKWDLHLELSVLAPNSTTNYFGSGNETSSNQSFDPSYHLVRFNAIDFKPAVIRKFAKYHSIEVGMGYRFVDVEKSEGRFISDTTIGVPSSALNPKQFGNMSLTYTLEKIDKKALPRRGYHFSFGAEHYVGIQDGTSQFTRLTAESRLYIPFNFALKTVVALRAGAATNLNDYDFYNANTLGATLLGTKTGTLRGYQRDRFSGRTIAYQNAEVRIKLFNFRSYLFPGQFGVLAYYDQGKVWTDGVKSNTWHESYGGGIWVSPFNEVVITTTYQISNEEKIMNITAGFQF